MSIPSGEQQPQAGPTPDTSQVWIRPIEARPPRTPAEETAHQLDILRRELNYYAQHLRRSRQTQLGHYEQFGLISGQQAEREQRLRRQESQLAADRATLEQDRRRQEEQSAADRAALDQRRHELDQQDRQAHERLTAEQARLDRLREEFEEKQSAVAQGRAATEQQQEERERWAADQAQQLADCKRQAEKLAEEKKDLAWSEAALHKQREQLQKLRAELTELQQASQTKDDSDKNSLRQELEALRLQLAEKDQRLAASEQQLADQEQLSAAARQKLERETAAYQQYEAELRNEIASLRGQLEEKQLAGQSPPPTPVSNIPSEPAAAPSFERHAVEFSIPPEPAFPEADAAAMGIEGVIAAKEAEENAAEREEVDAADAEEPAAIEAAAERESESLEPAAVGSVTVRADEFSGPLDFDNGALVLESVRGLVRADRQRVDEELSKLQARKGDSAATSLPPTVEKAPLTERRAQLERLRTEIRQDLERLALAAAGREGHHPPQQPGKPQASKPGPTKTRGTFMGLRRWLGG